MEVLVEYFDLFIFTLIPVAAQLFAMGYLHKVRRFLGRYVGLLLGGINLAILSYDILVVYLVLTINQRAVVEGRPPASVSPEGLYIGWFMPIAVAILSLLLQRRLAKTLVR